MAAKPCNKPLKSNPFIAYRDPITGKWIAIYQDLSKLAEQPQLAVA